MAFEKIMKKLGKKFPGIENVIEITPVTIWPSEKLVAMSVMLYDDLQVVIEGRKVEIRKYDLDIDSQMMNPEVYYLRARRMNTIEIISRLIREFGVMGAA